MPNYFPATSGVWSNLSNWLTAAGQSAGVLPMSADDIYSNNRVIYIDGNYQVNSIRNIAAPGITAGGYFVLNNGFALSAFVYGGGASDVACLQFLSAAPASATLVGNLCAGDPSARVLRPKAFENVSSGNFTIIGNCLGAINNGSNADLTNAANGIIENSHTGNLTLIGSFSGDILTPTADRRVIGIRNNSTGNIFLSGNVFGGTGGSSMGIYNNTTGSVFVTGAVLGGSGSSAAGIYNNSGTSGVVNVNVAGGAPLRGGSGGYGIYNNGVGTVFVVTTASDNGIFNNSGGVVTVLGDVVAGTTGSRPGVWNNGGTCVTNITGSVFGPGGKDGNIGSSAFTGGVYNSNVLGGTINVVGNVHGGGNGNNTGIFNDNQSATFNVRGDAICLYNSVAINLNVAGFCNLVGNVSPGPGVGILNNSGAAQAPLCVISVIGNVLGSNTSNNNGINVGQGTCRVVGNVTGQSGAGAGGGVFVSSGTVSVTGNVTGGPGGAGILMWTTNGGSGTCFVSGGVFGGSGATGIVNSGATSTVVVSGDVTGGSGSGIAGITQSGGGSTRISGVARGGTGGSGVSNTGSAARVEVKRAIANAFGVGSTGVVVAAYGVVGQTNNTTIVSEIESGVRGVFPVAGNVYINRTIDSVAIYKTNILQNVTMFTSLSGGNLTPATRDVRRNVVYDFGNLVGTLDMPSAAVVNAGVPVDNTVGTGVFTPLGVWSLPVSAIAGTTSMGARVKNSATNESIGNIISNLT